MIKVSQRGRVLGYYKRGDLEITSITAQGGYFITFNTGRSMPIFGVRNFTLNQYLGSVNYNMDKNSIFWVHKSEKSKNRGVWCESPRY